MTGRPSLFTQDLADEIVNRLSQGEALAAICRDNGICDDTVRDWAEKDPALSRDIARAREKGFDAIAYECMDIVDGKRPVDGIPADPSRDKARADTRLKLLAKWDPKRYGEMMKHAGHDAGPLPAGRWLRDDEPG